MRILVIEDEQKIRYFLKRSLQAECFAVDVAEDGEAGLTCALTNEYDLLIVDNILPGMHGPEICRTLREHEVTTPILMLSIADGTPMKVTALNDGADDYLTKPFSFEELLARIRALLRRPSGLTGEVLTIDGLTLDTKRHAVYRNDEEIMLTKKEFMLLEYLMRNQGIVLTRGMIMEHVWDMNADPFSNTIESHIRSLRKKLGDTREIIKTIPGRGYKIGT